MNHQTEDFAATADFPAEASGRLAVMSQAFVLLSLVAILYHGVVEGLVGQWWNDPNFSHGFLIPAFSAVVIWRSWRRLRSGPRSPSWSGVWVIGGALGFLVLGVLGAELFLARSSLVVLAAGLVVYFFGWPLFRQVLFPWACLFLMVPVPTILFNQVAFPLQQWAAQSADWTLRVLGVPVFRQGNILQLPAMSLEVAQACSGVRSLMSLVALAVIYGYFLEPRVTRRFLLVLAAIPIAVLANAFRIVGTGLLVQYWDASKAEGFFHAFGGWVIFVCAMILLFGTHRAMRLIDRWKARGRS